MARMHVGTVTGGRNDPTVPRGHPQKLAGRTVRSRGCCSGLRNRHRPGHRHRHSTAAAPRRTATRWPPKRVAARTGCRSCHSGTRTWSAGGCGIFGGVQSSRKAIQLHLGKHLDAALAQYHLPPGTRVQVQEPVEFVAEMRCWIVHGEVVTYSWYRIDDQIWGCEDWSPPRAYIPSTQRMLCFARVVARTVDAPPGFVLDVGLTADGRWLVVEANAAWSSGPYDGDPAAILAAITAAHDFDGGYPQWRWRPGVPLQKAGPLRVEAERRN